MKTRKRKTRKKTANAMPPRDEMVDLFHKISATDAPSEEDIQHYRKLAVAQPTRWRSTVQMSEVIRHDLMKRISHGVARSYAMAEEDILKREMGYNSSSPMERLLIEHILTTRLHALHAERTFNEQIMEAKTPTAGDYWQRFLSSAQRRHLQAIEALARVRRLMRGGPFVQVNIASDGGKQVNVQGELFGRDERSSALSGSFGMETNSLVKSSPHATLPSADEHSAKT